MVLVHATVLGGLPVVAEVWFSRGDGWMTDDDAGVDALYWRKRDGSKGAELSQKIMDRIEAADSYWQCEVTEQANDWLGCNAPTRYSDGRVEGEYSEAYQLLNGPREQPKSEEPVPPPLLV